MKVEVLYFEDCPNHIPTVEMVEGVLTREGIGAEVAAIEVPDIETAQALRFLGSPSVRVDGADIEPGREKDPPFYGCRTYSASGRTTGVPPEHWIVEALHRPDARRRFLAALGGTALVAVSCFTPVLVILLVLSEMEKVLRVLRRVTGYRKPGREVILSPPLTPYRSTARKMEFERRSRYGRQEKG